MTKIKLCGMMRSQDIDYVNELLPDYAGFILVQGLRRSIKPELAYEFSSKLDKRIKAVGVFIDDDLDYVTRFVKDGVIDIVQLHGKEDSDYIAKLRAIVKCPVIKAFKIQSNEDIEAAIQCSADYCLLDSGTGTGKTFDHSLIKGIDREYFLAGGISADNVNEAIDTYKPFAVDVSSALEVDGYKNFDKMKEFVDAVRHGQNGE